MAEVTRLAQCYRCRRVFVARQGERYCPSCNKEMTRERNRRRLRVSSTSGTFTPVLWTGLGGVAGALVGHPYLGVLGGAALLVWRRRTGR